MKNSLKLLFVGALFLPLSAFAGTQLNGTWVSNINPQTHMIIHHGIAQVSTSSPSACSGDFKAKVFKQGNKIVLEAPLNTKFGGRPFSINFKMSGGKLHEVAPYPNNNMERLGYWHGASCGFGLSEGPATFTKQN